MAKKRKSKQADDTFIRVDGKVHKRLLAYCTRHQIHMKDCLHDIILNKGVKR